MSNPWKRFSKNWWHHTERTEFIPGWGGGGNSISPLSNLILGTIAVASIITFVALELSK